MIYVLHTTSFLINCEWRKNCLGLKETFNEVLHENFKGVIDFNGLKTEDCEVDFPSLENLSQYETCINEIFK